MRRAVVAALVALGLGCGALGAAPRPAAPPCERPVPARCVRMCGRADDRPGCEARCAHILAIHARRAESTP